MNKHHMQNNPNGRLTLVDVLRMLVSDDILDKLQFTSIGCNR